MPKERGYYVYCIIKERKPQQFEIAGLGGLKDRIHTVHIKNLAAVVGRPPNGSGVVTREAAMAHEKVIEEVMKSYTVLPFKFGVVADSKAVREKLLRGCFNEFHAGLARLEGKVELDLKAFWLDMDKVFKEIGEELKLGSGQAAGYPERLAVGERVAELLVQKRRQEAAAILSLLQELAEECVEQETQSDRAVLNCAFLVQKKQEAVFDKAVAQIASISAERLKFKYVLSPPYNFVNLRLNLA